MAVAQHVMRNARLDIKALSVVSAAFSSGAPKRGPEEGPRELLQSGLEDRLKSRYSENVSFEYLTGEAPEPSAGTNAACPKVKNASAVSNLTDRLHQTIYDCITQKRFPLTLGGDHSIAIGTLTGVAKAVRDAYDGLKTATVWVDAHADINQPETSPSGFLHGMPVAFASGLARHGSFDWIGRRHLVDLGKFVYIGLRDVDDEEKRTIARHNICVFDMQDIKRLGIDEVMNATLRHIGDESAIHLSFDIDSLDPSWAPSTGFPVKDGMSLDDGLSIVRRLRETDRLVAMDLVEVNPLVSPSGKDRTLESARKVVYKGLGINEEARQ